MKFLRSALFGAIFLSNLSQVSFAKDTESGPNYFVIFKGWDYDGNTGTQVVDWVSFLPGNPTAPTFHWGQWNRKYNKIFRKAGYSLKKIRGSELHNHAVKGDYVFEVDVRNKRHHGFKYPDGTAVAPPRECEITLEIRKVFDNRGKDNVSSDGIFYSEKNSKSVPIQDQPDCLEPMRRIFENNEDPLPPVNLKNAP